MKSYVEEQLLEAGRVMAAMHADAVLVDTGCSASV